MRDVGGRGAAAAPRSPAPGLNAPPRPVYTGGAMSGAGGDTGGRRRSRRAVTIFVAVTLAFAAAVGVSRCMEIEALRTAAAPP